MLPQHQGLIISTTIYLHQGRYAGNLFYDISKTAINRMVYGPGTTTPEYCRDGSRFRVHANRKGPDIFTRGPERLGGLKRTESTEYIGRAVASLAADPNVMQKSGKVVLVRELARQYGFGDVDGRQVPPFHEQFLDKGRPAETQQTPVRKRLV